MLLSPKAKTRSYPATFKVESVTIFPVRGSCSNGQSFSLVGSFADKPTVQQHMSTFSIVCKDESPFVKEMFTLLLSLLLLSIAPTTPSTISTFEAFSNAFLAAFFPPTVALLSTFPSFATNLIFTSFNPSSLSNHRAKHNANSTPAYPAPTTATVLSPLSAPSSFNRSIFSLILFTSSSPLNGIANSLAPFTKFFSDSKSTLAPSDTTK
mmetsp:Transcript_4176/g.14585  ORF Transcript_4176/g.14585 Transcript_4176/m.14585 type:complete len:209 (-) Transcript_4176:631-1257(-)